MSVRLINLVVLVAIVNGVYSHVKLDVPELPNLVDGTTNYPLTHPKKEYRIILVSDLEREASEDSLRHSWHSFIKKGSLIYDSLSQEVDVKFDSGEENGTPVYSEYGNKNGRGFELSELTYFKGNLLAADDQTGLLYLYRKGQFDSWISVDRSPNREGNGEKVDILKNDGLTEEHVVMPIEWATAHGNILYVGPNGNNGINYVAKVQPDGDVSFVDFTDIFNNLKAEAEIVDGYMVHESCVFSEIHNEFYFLPKKASKTAYNEDDDKKNNAANILLSMDKDMSTFKKVADIQHPTVYKDRGYSSFAFVPGTGDELIVALQTSDVTDSTYITAFTTQGKVVLNSMKISDVPMEGVAFL